MTTEPSSCLKRTRFGNKVILGNCGAEDASSATVGAEAARRWSFVAAEMEGLTPGPLWHLVWTSWNQHQFCVDMAPNHHVRLKKFSASNLQSGSLGCSALQVVEYHPPNRPAASSRGRVAWWSDEKGRERASDKHDKQGHLNLAGSSNSERKGGGEGGVSSHLQQLPSKQDGSGKDKQTRRQARGPGGRRLRRSNQASSSSSTSSPASSSFSWVDQKTDLAFPSTLPSMLDGDESGPQHLLGGGSFYKYMMPVYSMAWYAETSSEAFASSLEPWLQRASRDLREQTASLTAETLMMDSKLFLALGTAASYDRTLVFKLAMSLNPQTMTKGMMTTWALPMRHKQQLLKAAQRYDQPCCARGTELTFTWRGRTGHLEIRLDGKLVDTIMDPLALDEAKIAATKTERFVAPPRTMKDLDQQVESLSLPRAFLHQYYTDDSQILVAPLAKRGFTDFLPVLLRDVVVASDASGTAAGGTGAAAARDAGPSTIPVASAASSPSPPTVGVDTSNPRAAGSDGPALATRRISATPVVVTAGGTAGSAGAMVADLTQRSGESMMGVMDSMMAAAAEAATMVSITGAPASGMGVGGLAAPGAPAESHKQAQDQESPRRQRGIQRAARQGQQDKSSWSRRGRRQKRSTAPSSAATPAEETGSSTSALSLFSWLLGCLAAFLSPNDPKSRRWLVDALLMPSISLGGGFAMTVLALIVALPSLPEEVQASALSTLLGRRDSQRRRAAAVVHRAMRRWRQRALSQGYHKGSVGALAAGVVARATVLGVGASATPLGSDYGTGSSGNAGSTRTR